MELNYLGLYEIADGESCTLPATIFYLPSLSLYDTQSTFILAGQVQRHRDILS